MGRRSTPQERSARRRVNYLVEIGKLPKPSYLPCADCGHRYNDFDSIKHEYDHHRGYSDEHREDVVAVCAPCHHKRTRQNIAVEKLRSIAVGADYDND